jgi:flavodoxin
MNTLVIFYSRTGTTKKVAESISKQLKADIEEIVDIKDRKGPMGYLFAGRDAVRKRLTKIQKIKKDPKEYDLVVIGTPIWAWSVSVPIRTYLSENGVNLKKVAFFCTMGGSGSENAFQQMQKICNKKPIALLELKTSEVWKNQANVKIKSFVLKLEKLKKIN